MKRYIQSLVYLALIVGPAQQVQAGIMLTIQPNAANDTILFSGTITFPHSPERVEDKSQVTDDDGGSLGSKDGHRHYNSNIGNFKTDANSQLFFRDGFGGFQVLSGPGLLDGFYFDDDGTGNVDDFGVITNGSASALTPGDFLASIPMHANGFNWNWNVGTYTSDPQVTIVVTTTPYDAIATPEPATLAMWGIGACGLMIGRKRRRWLSG